MAKGPTFSTITAAFASASKLNTNFDAIETSFQNTLSRDGSTPNTMIADFDMNSKNILNVNSLDVDTLVLGGTTVTAGELPAAVTTHDFDTKVIVAATNVDTGFTFIRTAGHSAIGDGGGALYKAVGSEPSHALKVQSNDGQWWEGAVPFMTPEMFGTAGDGVTNDLTKLQDMFDCTVSDTIMLGAGKTYYYETNGSVDNLTVTRAINLYTNGSTLHHKVISGSNNHALVFRTTMGTEETWTETISAYATVLTITSSLAVGDRIFIELGAHPRDGNESHLNLWATITANGGSSITIDKPIPFDINNTSHSLFPVTPNEGTYVDTIRIVQEGNSAFTLYLLSVRDFNLDSLIIQDGTIGLGITNGCENINIGSVGGNGRDGGTASTTGRAINSWGSKTINIGTVDWTHTVFDDTAVFLEAGAIDFHIGQLNLKRVLSSNATNPAVKVAGDSELHIDRYTITCNKNETFLGTESSTDIVTIDELVVWATPASSSLFSVIRSDKLFYQGTKYVDKVQLYKRTVINEGSSYLLEWIYGVPLKAFARLDDTTKVDAIWMKDAAGDNKNFLTLLTSGEWNDVSTAVNSDRALNTGTRFRLLIDGKTSNTAVLETWVEYWRDPDVTELSELSPWDENRGEVTDTTDGSGDIVIAHGLGAEPRVVNVQMKGLTDFNTTVHTKGATNFSIRVYDAAGAAKTSTAVTVLWSAAL